MDVNSLIAIGIVMLVINILSPSLASPVPDNTVTLNGELDDVEVGFVDDRLEFLCKVNGVSLPISDIHWKTNGKMIDNFNEPYGFSVGNNLIYMEQYLKIERLSEDMDGMTVTCSYSQHVLHNGISSWSTWPAKAELVLLTMTIDTSKQACDTGVGDMHLRFKEVGSGRKINVQTQKKSRSKIEDITGSKKIKYRNFSYSVTLPFDKVINNQRIVDMDPELTIDGNPSASCLKFNQAPQIDSKGSVEYTYARPVVNAVFGGMYTILLMLLLTVLVMVIIMYRHLKIQCNNCCRSLNLVKRERLLDQIL